MQNSLSNFGTIDNFDKINNILHERDMNYQQKQHYLMKKNKPYNQTEMLFCDQQNELNTYNRSNINLDKIKSSNSSYC